MLRPYRLEMRIWLGFAIRSACAANRNDNHIEILPQNCDIGM